MKKKKIKNYKKNYKKRGEIMGMKQQLSKGIDREYNQDPNGAL